MTNVTAGPRRVALNSGMIAGLERPGSCTGNNVMTEAEMNYLLYPLVIALALGLALVSAASYSL